jgi:protein-disulfide isomerase
MRRYLAVLLMLAAATVGFAGRTAAAAADQPAGFSAGQRAEIVDILRTALKTDPSILRDAITALQAQEATIKEATARAALERAGPNLAHATGDPMAGNPNGDVTVVEFYDLKCPYCRRMLPVMAELLRKDPKVRLVYKDIPILGPGSVLGARAVLAAQKQDGYQRLHDAVMTGAPDITQESLHTATMRVGLDWDRLQRDMTDPAIQSRIDANLEVARNLGVDGTPVYVIGTHVLPGAVELAELESTIAAVRAQ